MREVIALLRERVNDIVKGLEGQRCVQNSQHAIDSYTSFVCTFPGCENRAVCSRCILEDKEHINAHKKYLKTLEDFSEDSMDLCTDLFASEMDKVSAEVKTKFEKKVQFCASSCTEQITKILAEQFPLEMEEIVEVFNELIISHCESISHESQEKIKLLGSDFVNKTDKVQAGLNSSSKRTLERLIRFMSSKGEEEEHLWESAGKILHRQKHRIIYNKKLDEDLNSDIDKITAKYIRDVTETFRSYFIARETDVMSIIPIREEDSESEYEFVKDEFSMDENENSNSSAIHIQVTDNVQPQSRLARNVEIEAIQTVSVKPDRSPDNDKTRLDDQVPLSPLPHSPRQRARTEPPKLHHIENFRAIAGIGALVEDSSLSRAKKTHAFQMWLPNDSSKFSTMFTEDVRFFCIADLLRDGNDLARFMQHFYEAYYPGLFYIFLNYQSVSMTYPGLSWMEMNSLMRKCGIFNESFEERLCDEVYQDVLYTTKGVLVKEMTESVANSVESYLLRGGFMSYLTRVALLRYYMSTYLTYHKPGKKRTFLMLSIPSWRYSWRLLRTAGRSTRSSVCMRYTPRKLIKKSLSSLNKPKAFMKTFSILMDTFICRIL